MSVKVIQAGVEQVALASPLFDAYRQFNGRKSDLPGATVFLTERLAKGESVVFLALDGQAALGFVLLYPSFSSVRMMPIWILNDLFVAEAALGLARSTWAARLVLSTAKDNGAAKSLYLSLRFRMDDAFDHLELPLD